MLLLSVLFLPIFLSIGETLAIKRTLENTCPKRLLTGNDLFYLQLKDNYCYRFVITHKREYNDANRDCMRDGGTLALPKSKEVNDYLTRTLLRLYQSNQPAWIGLHDQEDDSTFVWEDEQRMLWNNFARGNGPGNNFFQGRFEDCAALHPTDGHWHDYQCHWTLISFASLSETDKNYICQYTTELPTINPPRVNESATTEPTDYKIKSTEAYAVRDVETTASTPNKDSDMKTGTAGGHESGDVENYDAGVSQSNGYNTPFTSRTTSERDIVGTTTVSDDINIDTTAESNKNDDNNGVMLDSKSGDSMYGSKENDDGIDTADTNHPTNTLVNNGDVYVTVGNNANDIPVFSTTDYTFDKTVNDANASTTVNNDTTTESTSNEDLRDNKTVDECPAFVCDLDCGFYGYKTGPNGCALCECPLGFR